MKIQLVGETTQTQPATQRLGTTGGGGGGGMGNKGRG